MNFLTHSKSYFEDLRSSKKHPCFLSPINFYNSLIFIFNGYIKNQRFLEYSEIDKDF